MVIKASRDARSEMPLDEMPTERGRPKTMSRREIQREERRRQRAGDVLEIIPYDRPMNRSECRSASRPCLFVACKYHLYLDVNPETGSIKMNFPEMEVFEDLQKQIEGCLPPLPHWRPYFHQAEYDCQIGCFVRSGRSFSEAVRSPSGLQPAFEDR